MTDLTLVTKIWNYATCITDGKPQILLARRLGSENEFWHLPCGGMQTVAGSQRTEDMIINAAKEGLIRETNLNPQQARDLKLLLLDETGDSDWSKAHVAHMLTDFGRQEKFPDFTAKSVETPNGRRGPALLEWVKIEDIQVRREPNADVSPAASQHAFYKNLPLRSMAARILGEFVLPELIQTYGPLRPSQLINPVITAARERFPQP